MCALLWAAKAGLINTLLLYDLSHVTKLVAPVNVDGTPESHDYNMYIHVSNGRFCQYCGINS